MGSSKQSVSAPTADAAAAFIAAHAAEQPVFSRKSLDCAWERLMELFHRKELNVTITGASCGLQAFSFNVKTNPLFPVSGLGSLRADLSREFGGVRLLQTDSAPSRQNAGIEIPAPDHLHLCFSTLLASEKWQASQVVLPLPLGWDIGRGLSVADLKDAPHLLITGAGKSEQAQILLGIAASLALRLPPHLLNFLFWDPTGIMKPLHRLPHADTLQDSCIGMLEWLEHEKHRREKILANAGVGDIDAYNASNPERPLPRVAAFLLDTGKTNLSTLPGSGISDSGRLGLHIIAAFTTLDEDDALEVVKLFPWRIILKNSPSGTALNSRQGRSRNCNESTLLLGSGDMLFVTPDSNRRIQAPDFSKAECRTVTKCLNKIFNRKYFSKHKTMNDLDSKVSGKQEEPLLPFTDAPQPVPQASVPQPPPVDEFLIPDDGSESEGGHSPIALDALKVIIKSGETTTEALSLALEISMERAVNLLDELTSHEYLGYLEPDGTRRILFDNIPPEYLGKAVRSTRKDLDFLYAELKRKVDSQDTTSRTVEEYNKGVHAIGKKIIEEAGEVWMSAEHEAPEHTAEEISQLIYHLVVLMLRRGLTPEDIYKNL